MPPGSNSWNEYRRLVLAHLERHEEQLSAIETKVESVRTEIALLKVKSSFFGALSGGIAAGIAIFLGT